MMADGKHLDVLPSRRIILLIIVITCQEILSVIGQELPYFTTPNAMNYSISHRQNVCKLNKNYLTGKVELRDALSGTELHVLLDTEFYTAAPDGGIGQGLYVTILDRLAESANFTWRNTYGIADTLQISATQNATYTDILLWGIQTYDVYVNWWSYSLSRMNEGVIFPAGWLDGSLILVGLEDSTSAPSGTDWMAFIAPFDTNVWIAILITMATSGFIYQFLEYGSSEHSVYDTNNEERWWRIGPIEHLYLVLMGVLGHVSFLPTRRSTKLFMISLTAWSMLMLATYTANLASFYVVQNSGASLVESIQDATERGLSVCVWENVYDDEFVTSRYPEAKYLRLRSEHDVYEALKSRQCVLAVTSVATFNRFSVDDSINSDCNLVRVGSKMSFAEAGFALKADSGVLCTSLIRDVLNLHFSEMKEERAFHNLFNIWNEYLQEINTANCKEEFTESNEKSLTLDLRQLAGNFLFHYVTTAIAILCSLISRYYKGTQQEDQQPQQKTDVQLHQHQEKARDSFSISSSTKENHNLSRRLKFQANAKQSYSRHLLVPPQSTKNIWPMIGSSSSILDNHHVMNRILSEFKLLNERIDDMGELNNTKNDLKKISEQIPKIKIEKDNANNNNYHKASQLDQIQAEIKRHEEKMADKSYNQQLRYVNIKETNADQEQFDI